MTDSPLSTACVVLVRTQGPINLGMVARLCGNLGVSDLRLVAPLCEVNCAESRMFSTHSRELLLHAPIYPTLEQALADCGLAIATSARMRGGEMGPGLKPEEVPRLLTRRPASRYAVVFGNEADGLNDDELRCCQAWLQLSTFGPNPSYNLANACAIILYQIACAGPPASSELPEAASRSHVEDLYRYWRATLDRFQYFRRTDAERFSPQLRKFISRLHLSLHDVQVLRGMLAQFNYFTFGDRAVPEAEPVLPGDVGGTTPASPRSAAVADACVTPPTVVPAAGVGEQGSALPGEGEPS